MVRLRSLAAVAAALLALQLVGLKIGVSHIIVAGGGGRAAGLLVPRARYLVYVCGVCMWCVGVCEV